MSYYPPPMGPPVPPVPPPTPAASLQRPTTVTAACGVMLVMAVLEFVSVAVGLAALNHVDNVLASYNADTSSTKYSFLFSIGGGLVAVGLLTMLSITNLRGLSWARVFAFVLAGLGIACCGCSSASVFSAGALLSSAAEQSGGQVPDIYPGWYVGTAGTIDIVGLLLCVVVIVLLAMRTSGAWYAAMSGRQPAAPQQYPPPAYPGY